MLSRQYILEEMKSRLLPDFVSMRQFMKIVIPRNDDDKHMIELYISMLSDIIDDISNADDISELNSWFDVQEIMDNWGVISNTLVTENSTAVNDFIYSVTDSVIVDND